MRLPIFCLCIILIVSACTKNKNTAIPDTIMNANMPTMVYFYDSADTSGIPVAYDTISYNLLKKISRVRRYFALSPADSMQFYFGYQNDSCVSFMTVQAPGAKKPWFKDFRFNYNYNWKLERMRYITESHDVTFNFNYDDQWRLQSYQSSFTRTNGDSIPLGTPYAKGVYYRSATGNLDSLVTGVFDRKVGNDTLYHSKVITLRDQAALPADAIDKSYLLCLSAFSDFYLMSADFNVFWEQFFQGDVSLYRSGRYATGDHTQVNPIDFTAVLYDSKNVKWIVNPVLKNKTGWVMAKIIYGDVKFN